MEKKQETFEYSYSSKQKQEIEKIRKKYLPQSEDKLRRLRELDRRTTKKACRTSILVGIAGCILFGTGMCCTMVWMGRWFIPGVIIGLIGLAVMGTAYPLYMRIGKKEREKIAPQILELSEQLLEQ